MLGEGTLAKLVLVPAVLLVGAEIIPKILQSGAEAVVLAAAALAAIGFLGRGIRRGYRNVRAFVTHVRNGIDTIETVPERLDKIEGRLEDGERRFASIDKSLDVIAGANAARVDDAIAGDDRKPRVDRRRVA